MLKIDTLKTELKKLINRYEKIEKDMWHLHKDEFYELYRNDFKTDLLLLNSALFCEKWVNVIDGKIVLTEKGKKVVKEIESKKKKINSIIRQIVKLLKEVPVFVISDYANYGLTAEFGRIYILIENNSLTYKDLSYKMAYLADEKIYRILKNKEFLCDKQTRRKLEKWFKKIETKS